MIKLGLRAAFAPADAFIAGIERAGSSPGLSFEDADHRRIDRRWHRHGCAGADLRRKALRPRSASRWWSRTSPAPRPCWRRRSGDLAARWPHPGGADQLGDGDQSHRSTSRSTTPRKRFRADLALCEVSVHPGGQSHPAGKTVPEFIKYAKEANPPLNYASVGAGGASASVDGVRQAALRFGATHVPYRQTGQSVTDLAAGHVDVGFVEAGASIPLIKEGRLRALAVSASHVCRCCPTCRRSRKRRARRISRRCPGTSCWFRRRRRKTSSIACMRR